ncbi:MAG: sulfatase family protein [Puniceicoccales bacterium]
MIARAPIHHSPKNVIVVIADDTDPFNLGCYGGDDFLTPNLDAFAQSGMQFMKAEVVAPVCTPSRWCYLTGKYPGRCKGEAFLDENPIDRPYNLQWNTDIQPGETNLATIMRAANYTTGYVGKFHAGRYPEKFGLIDLEMGHDPYSPESANALRKNQEMILEEMRRIGWDDPRAVTWGNLDFQTPHNIETHNLEWTTAAALSFLEDHKDDEKPFCLYYGLHTIHGPKHGENLAELDPHITAGGPINQLPDADMPSRASVLQRLRDHGLDPYHRNVGALWMDDAFGAIMRRLDKLGLRDNTLVIFKADHGKYSKATVYDAGARVPMIWSDLDTIEPDSKNRQFVQNIDFLPTLLDYLGITLPANYPIDGVSYKHLLEGSHEPIRQYFYNEMGMARSIHNERWKYIALRYSDSILEQLGDGRMPQLPNHIGIPRNEGSIYQQTDYFAADQLYDLQQDRYENINLANHPDYQEVLQKMKAELKKVLDSFDHPFPLEANAFYSSEDYLKLGQATRGNNRETLGKGSCFGERYW